MGSYDRVAPTPQIAVLSDWSAEIKGLCVDFDGEEQPYLQEYTTTVWARRHGVLADCSKFPPGTCLRFTDDVDDFSDDAVKSLVAHELAHVFQAATDFLDIVDADDYCGDTIELDDRNHIEFDADQTALRWGFDCAFIDEEAA